ncbi:unnamed protein product, partial [Didymodactylos carnosus]
MNEVHLIKVAEKVGASEAALLNVLNISAFSYGLIIRQGKVSAHLVMDGFKRLLALAADTDIEFEQAKTLSLNADRSLNEWPEQSRRIIKMSILMESVLITTILLGSFLPNAILSREHKHQNITYN